MSSNYNHNNKIIWVSEDKQFWTSECIKCGYIQKCSDWYYRPQPLVPCLSEPKSKYIINYYGDKLVVLERIEQTDSGKVIEIVPCSNISVNEEYEKLEKKYPDHTQGLWAWDKLDIRFILEKQAKQINDNS